MNLLVYLWYPILAVFLLYGAKLYKKGEWNDGFLSLEQTKALQGFCAVCIMFHHIAQKTCAFWLDPKVIIPGLEPFVRIGYWLVGIFLFCSGYGLYKSYREKENYLKSFVGKRILPLVLAFYSTAWIFLIARLLVGEKLGTVQMIYYITGLQLSNTYSWFVCALPIFYLGFYLCFKYIKNENIALTGTCLVVLIYVIIGTVQDHNPWWMRGEWWYNSVHLLPLGMLFAKYEKSIVEKVKRKYVLYLVLGIIGIILLHNLSIFCEDVFSYYGENWGAPDKVQRRWICLVSQQLTSCAFVFTVFMAGMKLRIGNKMLAFMGTITLEFYLLHGLFVELFGYSFMDICSSVYYIRNVFLFVLVVFVPSVPLAVLLQKGLRRLQKWIVRGRND